MIVAPYRSEPAWGALGCERAILVVTDPERSIRARAEQLRQLFDLTAAEAAVAMQLTEGDGLAAVASRLGVSSSTVRTHLTRIFDKTSTHRQAELVRLLLQST